MNRRTSLCLGGIVVLALALRLPRFLAAQVVLTEGTTYATLARNLAAGRGYVGILGVQDYFVPPLYPLFMSVFVRLGLDAVWAGRAMSLVLGALLPLPLFWLTQQMSGRRWAGLFAALIMAGHPLLIVFASRAWSETLYSLLVWCGLCAAWVTLRQVEEPVTAPERGEVGVQGLQVGRPGSPRGRGAPRGWLPAALAGLLFGAAYLTRHEGAVYLVVFLALQFAVWTWRRWSGHPRREAESGQQEEVATNTGTKLAHLLRPVAASVIAFALLAVPYVVWLSDQAGRFIWETKSAPNFVAARRLASGLDYMEAAYGLTASGEPAGPFLYRNELIREPPYVASFSLADRLQIALRTLKDEASIFLAEIASPLVVILMLFGLMAGQLLASWPRARPGAALVFLLAFLVPAMIVVSLVPRVYVRYLTPLTGYVALWGGMGLAVIYRWIRGEKVTQPLWRQVLGLAVPVLVLVASLQTIQGGLLAFQPRGVEPDVGQRLAGEWLAEYDPASDKRIMSVHSQLPFYAQGVHVPMPYADPALAAEYAESQGVDYVVVSVSKLHGRAPLEPWTRGEQLPPEWRLVYEDPDDGLSIYATMEDV